MLSETLSLSHDLGHTPFGHAGEKILSKCMNKYGHLSHSNYKLLELPY